MNRYKTFRRTPRLRLCNTPCFNLPANIMTLVDRISPVTRRL
jgi:hypothetical protein